MYDVFFRGMILWKGINHEKLGAKLETLVSSLDEYSQNLVYKELGYSKNEINKEKGRPLNFKEFLDSYKWSLPKELELGYTSITINKHLM